MVTLTGTLRQTGKVSFEGKERLKLWIEYTMERENGQNDLKIEELFLPVDQEKGLPSVGSEIHLSVRPYASGKAVKWSAIGLASRKVAA